MLRRRTNNEYEFQDNADLGGGFGVILGSDFGTPFMLGIEFGKVEYDRQQPKNSYNLIGVRTVSSIIFFHALLRMQHDRGFFRPYLDGLIGVQGLKTTMTNIDEDYEESTIELRDAALSYGVGGGMMLRVHRFEKNDREGMVEVGEVLIDFRVRYLFGGEASYVKKGSITREDGAFLFDRVRSRTDLLIYQIGVALNL